MKNGPKIFLVLAMAFTMSVAANSKASRTQVCVVDDVGDTKVVKNFEFTDVVTINVYENMQIVNLDYAVILENETVIVNKPVSLTYNVVKPNRSEKIYLINCNIKQCSYRTVAAG